MQLIKGGNVIKQGHDFKLDFNLFDSEGMLVDLSGATVGFKLAQSIGAVVLSGVATVEGIGHISISVNSDIGYGAMRVEFTSTKGGIVHKFPSDDFVRLSITPSLDDLGYTSVNTITVEEFKKQIEEATGYAINQGDRAKEYSDNIDTVMKEGPVQTVNGKTGNVSGLTEQVEFNTFKNETNSQLAETLNVVNSLPFQADLLGRVTGRLRRIEFPEGWKWIDAPINIYKDFNGRVFTDFDVAALKPQIEGKTYYVAVDGNDANDGLTPETPFRGIRTAMGMPDRAKIIVGGGVYDRLNGFAGVALNKDVIIENKLGEKPIISAHDTLNWTKTSGMTNVYQANRSAVNDVYDAKFINEFGDYKELIKKNSIAEVDQAQGSWYTDGSIVYVHAANSREVDDYIRSMMNTNNGRYIGGGTVYLEGIAFEGGNSAFRVENTADGLNTKIIAKNCKFKYTKLLNAFHAMGVEAYLQNCESAYAMQDGFNYHINNGVICKVIEVDCVGRNNGKDGANQNNGSTNHDGGYTIRVNGDYHNNVGPNIIDVNEGAQSWNLGVSAHESLADKGLSNSNFKNGNVGKSEMWLDSCVSFGSDYSLVTQGEGSTSYENNNILTEGMFNDVDTKLKSYVPVLRDTTPSYTEIKEIRLTERRNYDRRTGTGWVEVTNTSHYTTVIGDTMKLEFEGVGVDFYTPLHDRGGIWEFKVDGGKPVIISTNKNATEDKELAFNTIYKATIARGLSDGRHNLIATFKGEDPKNPPSSGDARGYVCYGVGSTTYSTFDIYGY